MSLSRMGGEGRRWGVFMGLSSDRHTKLNTIFYACDALWADNKGSPFKYYWLRTQPQFMMWNLHILRVTDDVLRRCLRHTLKLQDCFRAGLRSLLILKSKQTFLWGPVTFFSKTHAAVLSKTGKRNKKKKKNFAQVIHHRHCIIPFTGPLTENFPSLIKCQQSSEMNAFKVCVKDSQQDPESKASAKGENG